MLTMITIAGYPRSGTTFLTELLKKSFPEKQFNRTHAIDNTINDIFVVSVIRDPKECIPSWMITFNDKKFNIDDNLNWYISHLKALKNRKLPKVVLDFKEFIKSPEDAIVKCSNEFGLGQGEIVDLEELFLKINTDRTTKFLPNPSRQHSHLIKDVVNSKLYDEAIALYSEIIEVYTR